ncbi:MAG: UvrD-helicase domain-containing protein, partial [Rehaibacterium terrae]|uniref:UvrD-helicase domain-containing protein n=1 Tax=Rehaibacterium terrae TaxID=1341696 RepID=UPI003918FFB5
QLSVIQTTEKRLIIEAPAGYGKTKTMTSQIAYILASKKLSNPKKILVLTFSVNAAYKIKRDILTLSNEYKNDLYLSERVFATNYHGFCRRFLKLYGYLENELIKNIDNLNSIDDSDIETLMELNDEIDYNIAKFITDFNDAVKKVKKGLIKNLIKYNKYVAKYLLPENFIPFNAILTFTIQLMLENKNLRNFFQKLYPIIIVDEFQDTNILSYILLNLLVGEDTWLYLYGDPLQRIYGFIGAIPDLMNKAEKHFKAKKIKLQKNYRFKDNPDMLNLDKNLRLVAQGLDKKHLIKPANIKLYLAEDQEKESKQICKLLEEILSRERKKVAILTRQRSKNIDKIIELLRVKNIDFFYALFSDEDVEYKKFHKEVLRIFYNKIKTTKHFRKSLLKGIKEEYSRNRKNERDI